MLMVLPFSAKAMERVSTDLQCTLKLFCTLESEKSKIYFGGKMQLCIQQLTNTGIKAVCKK